MSDLVEFLLARISEGEAEWRRVAASPRGFGKTHALRHLAECEAKRRILAMHEDDHEHSCPNEDGTSDQYGHLHGWAEESEWPQRCATLRLLALPYADHPDFREAWRP